MDTIVIVSACIFLVFALLGKGLYHCIVNPITVFCGLWGAILLLYSLPSYDMYKATDEVMTLIISGTGMFFLGAITAALLFFRANHSSITNPSILSDSLEIRYIVLLVLNIIVFVFLVGFSSSVIGMLLSGRNFSYVHKMYNVVDEDGTLGASSINRSIVSWIVWPVLHASLSSLAVYSQCDVSNKNPLKKWCTVAILSNLSLFTLISGKRTFLFDIILYFIAVYYLRGKKLNLSRKAKFGIIIVACAVIWFFNYITVGRGTSSITRLFYVYLVGCIPHLSYKFQQTPIDIVGFTSIYGFFQAPITLINAVIHSQWLSSIRDSMSQLTAFTQVRVPIGPGMTYNAFLTPFYYFYLDGGWVGNLVLSFLFGFATTQVFHNYLKKKDLYSVVIYLLVFFSLCMSMVRIQYFQMRFVLSFFYAYLIFDSHRIKIVFNKRQAPNKFEG